MKRITKEHFKILQVDANADLDIVKKAYRKRAFELHPDLNPNNKNAQSDFQKLNEAYILLIEYYNQEKEAKAQASAKYQEQSKNTQEQSSTASSNSSTHSSAKAESKSEEKKTSTQESAKQEQQKTETHKRTYAKSTTGTTDTKGTSDNDARKKAQSAYAKEGSKAQSRVFSEKAKKHDTNENAKAPTQEEVMRDILNDPFARRVYEDIYSSLNKEEKTSGKKTKENKKESAKSVDVDWNTKPASELTNNVKGYMKSWFKKQIDDTLEFRFPIASLYPGSRIRLQIGQGFSKETRTVDITLPRDFVIGKPVRLAGMGKKVGKWQGDLFIVLLPALPKEK